MEDDINNKDIYEKGMEAFQFFSSLNLGGKGKIEKKGKNHTGAIMKAIGSIAATNGVSYTATSEISITQKSGSHWIKNEKFDKISIKSKPGKAVRIDENHVQREYPIKNNAISDSDSSDSDNE